MRLGFTPFRGSNPRASAAHRPSPRASGERAVVRDRLSPTIGPVTTFKDSAPTRRTSKLEPQRLAGCGCDGRGPGSAATHAPCRVGDTGGRNPRGRMLEVMASRSGRFAAPPADPGLVILADVSGQARLAQWVSRWRERRLAREQTRQTSVGRQAKRDAEVQRYRFPAHGH